MLNSGTPLRNPSTNRINLSSGENINIDSDIVSQISDNFNKMAPTNTIIQDK